VSASTIELHDFCLAFCADLPKDIAPTSLDIVRRWLATMRAAADRGDAAEVASLADMVRERIAQGRGRELQ
jgi:hypothetical protein